MSDVTFDMKKNTMEVHHEHAEPWRVTLVDTGERTNTGGRLKRVFEHVKDEEVFALTYGDGVGNVDLTAQYAFHRAHGKLATVTAVRPAKRFGVLTINGDRVVSFAEKPEDEGGWISGGFFLLSPKVCDLIEGDDTVFERGPMMRLAETDEFRAYVHSGFWAPMDTLRDKIALEEEWASGNAAWRVW
jgi:glucose-1-phosphate cytidylyltransferase